MNDLQIEMMVELLQRCLPHLDLAVSEHRDGSRLLRDICLFLAGAGYPGEYQVRFGRAEKEPPKTLTDEGCTSYLSGAYYRKVRQG